MARRLSWFRPVSRSGNTQRRTPRPPIILEQLEPRVLLSDAATHLPFIEN
jgi:hypothetical protein